jgi:acid phosphatase
MRTRLLAFVAAAPLLVGMTFLSAQAASARPTAPGLSAAGPCGTVASAPTYTHVIWVWMENHSYDTIIGSSQAPYINSLAGECGLATN